MIQTPKEFCVENDKEVNKALLIVMVIQPQHSWPFGQGNSLQGRVIQSRGYRCSEGVSQHPWTQPTKSTLLPSCDNHKCLPGVKKSPLVENHCNIKSETRSAEKRQEVTKGERSLGEGAALQTPGGQRDGQVWKPGVTSAGRRKGEMGWQGGRWQGNWTLPSG